MTDDDLDQICVRDPAIRGGTPVVRGTRVGLFEVAEEAKHETVEAMLAAYPSLTARMLRAACEYAARHPEHAPTPAKPRDVPGAQVTTYLVSGLESRLEFPDAKWERIESVEEFTKDAREHLDKLDKLDG